MKVCALAGAILLWALLSPVYARWPGQADDYRQLTEMNSLPVALDSAFEFRKTKLFSLGSVPGRKTSNFGSGAVKDPAILSENAYRLFGAVTELDKRRRSGQYFDFFWRAKKDALVTVRFEYRQDGLRSLTQGREVDYARGAGSHKTAFAVVGDDFFSDGRIIAWRCVLIVNGRIVAEEKSYLWR